MYKNMFHVNLITQKREHDVTDFFQRMKDVKPGRFVSGVK